MNLSPPDVHIRIGVGVEFCVADEPLRVSRFQQALLVLLAHAGSAGITKESLFRLLWESDDDPPTRHRLRQLSYSLNRLAPGTLVRAAGSMVHLVDDGAVITWLDEELGIAIAPPTAAFADRLAEIGEERRRLAQLGSARELDAARLADSPEAVIESLRNGPRTTGSWRDLLWALLRTGRVREAEVELNRVLGDDVPAEGLPSIRKVATEKDELLSLAAGGGHSSLPLRGRDEDVRRLHGLLVAGSRSILITGAQGVGRTRMLGQALATLLANRDDSVILSATGMPFDRHSPFGGLSQLLADELLPQAFAELGQPETEIIRRALPVQFPSDQSHALAEIGGPGSYLRVARAVTELFERAYGSAEVLLVIDDLHEIDRSSFEVIVRLIHIGSARLLATWCTEGPGAHTELLLRLHGLDPDLVTLADLPLAEASAVVQSVAPELSSEQADDIARIAGGRPGRLVELVQALGASPLLASSGGPTIDELLRRRVADLSEGEQQALVFLAVNGGQLDVSALGQLMGAGILESAGLARGLEAAGLVRLEGDRVAVAPSLLTQFVSRELPGPIRRDTHAAIAELLLRDDTSAEPGAVAHHLLEADRAREAAVWFRRAGLGARDRTAYAEAILFLEKCVMAEEGTDPDIAKQLGLLHSGMGDYRQAIHWYGRARIGYVERGDQAGDVEVVLEELVVAVAEGASKEMPFSELRRQLHRARDLRNGSLVGRALDLWLGFADHYHARLEAEEGKEMLLHTLPSFADDVFVQLPGARLTYLGRPELGLVLGKRAYLRSRRDPSLGLRTLKRLLLCFWSRGLFTSRTAQQLVRKADRLAGGSGDVPSRISLWSGLGLWHLDSGNWDQAEQAMEAARQASVLPSDRERGAISLNLAILSLRRGEIGRALDFVDELADLPMRLSRTITAIAESVRLIVALERGRLGVAAELAEGLRQVDLSFPFASNLSLVPEALAEFMRRQGRLDGAQRFLVESAALMGAANVPARWYLERRAAQWSSRNP